MSWGHIFRFSRLGWEWPCVSDGGRLRVRAGRPTPEWGLGCAPGPPRGTAIPGLGSPGTTSSPPGGPGPHQGPGGRCRVTMVCDRPRLGCVFAGLPVVSFHLADSAFVWTTRGSLAAVTTGNAAGEQGGRPMRGSSPARARWSEAPNKLRQSGRGRAVRVARRREPEAVCSTKRATEHARTGER